MIVQTGDKSGSSAWANPHPSKDGLRLLYQAFRYAIDVNSEPWDFAVEFQTLLRSGMTRADVRWLIHKGYLLHAHEVAFSDRPQREFRFHGTARICKRSCFCLTAEGAGYIASLCRLTTEENLGESEFSSHSAHSSANDPGSLLRWDGERHQFFVNGCLVKEYKVPSPNQETILAAFQEDGWPVRIDDPLTPCLQMDRKRRLQDTIKSLNRNQKQSLIRFMGDGTGEGVRWEVTAQTPQAGTQSETCPDS